MKFAIHLLRKDARLLWWQIVLAQVPMLALGHLDRWRSGFVLSPAENALSVLAPLAWAALLAQAVHQEPLTEPRAAWLTWPIPRGSLLATKVLFGLCFVQMPLLLIHTAVLFSHGFSVVDGWAALLRLQAVVLVAVTLPSLSLAAVTSSLARFIAIAGGAVSVVLFAAWASRRPGFPWLAADESPWFVLLGLLTGGAVAALMWQYRSRRVLAARLALAIAFAAGLGGFRLAPRRISMAQVNPVRELGPERGEFRLLPPIEGSRAEPRSRLRAEYYLPLRTAPGLVDRLPGGSPASVEIRTPAGRVIRIAPPGHRGAPEEAFAQLLKTENGAGLLLLLPRQTASDVEAGPISLSGVARGAKREEYAAVVRPASDGGTVRLPGGVLCRASRQTERGHDEFIRVDCKSPRGGLPLVRLRVVSRDGAYPTESATGIAMTGGGGPQWDWLSPLERRSGFIHLVEEPPVGAGDRWRFPAAMADEASIEYYAPRATIVTTVSFDLGEVDLRAYRR